MYVTRYILTAVTLLCLLGCRNAENKADREKDFVPDTSAKQEKPAEPATPSGTSRGLDNNNPDILAKIDQHLVSKPVYDAPATTDAGISNATVTITNTLTNITFQKVLVEVSILLADGKEYRTDYYTVINIEPGETKAVKIPNTTRGNKVTSHIVKLKSAELTGGEMILVGDRYVPG